jgi:hypothetical protein
MYTVWSKSITLHLLIFNFNLCLNRIGGVVVDVFASSTVDRGFDPRSSQYYEIGMCCSSAKQAAF